MLSLRRIIARYPLFIQAVLCGIKTTRILYATSESRRCPVPQTKWDILDEINGSRVDIICLQAIMLWYVEMWLNFDKLYVECFYVNISAYFLRIFRTIWIIWTSRYATYVKSYQKRLIATFRSLFCQTWNDLWFFTQSRYSF